MLSRKSQLFFGVPFLVADLAGEFFVAHAFRLRLLPMEWQTSPPFAA